jgi:hypothetical protein
VDDLVIDILDVIHAGESAYAIRDTIPKSRASSRRSALPAATTPNE